MIYNACVPFYNTKYKSVNITVMKFAKTRTMIDRFLWIHPFHFSRTLPLKIQRLTSLILWNCDPHPLFDWLQKSRSKGRGGGIIIPILLEAERGYVLIPILLKGEGVISYYTNPYFSEIRKGVCPSLYSSESGRGWYPIILISILL